ncbi:MAG: flagellar motor protein MotB [Alphaproteobacteria bacterium]|nr:flagellar motor protein MotB [Alphaproteobacteria bacterium]
MAGQQPQQPIIMIRKKKGGDHGGHHGGAWKVAYADFVTAMMSFFLLMWLLNVTTDAQRRGLADYFAPASISLSPSGSGGAMGGQTITSSGAQISDKSPPGQEEEAPTPTAGKGDVGEEDVPGKSEKSAAGNAPEGERSAGKQKAGDQASGTSAEGDRLGDGKGENIGDLGAAVKNIEGAVQREEARFKKAEEILKKAIDESPALQEFSKQLLIDRTPEGLRIQIVDQDKYSMFPSGSATPYERARELMRTVGKVISWLSNDISITGHTDSSPFPIGSRRDNWSLSTDRANVSRAELVKAGVAENRIARVVGMAERDPMVPEDPKDPKNRRISIVLLRKAIPVAEGGVAQSAAAPSAATPSAPPAPSTAPAAAPPGPVAVPTAPNIAPPKPD